MQTATPPCRRAARTTRHQVRRRPPALFNPGRFKEQTLLRDWSSTDRTRHWRSCISAWRGL